MTKADLRTGMLVTTRSGEPYYIMLNTGLPGEENDIMIQPCGNSNCWMPLSSYDDDLFYHDRPDGIFPQNTPEEDRKWDIVKVEKTFHAAYVGHGRYYKTIMEERTVPNE